MKYYKINKKNKRRWKQRKIKHRRLIKKYPWLAPRNVWTGKLSDDYDYSYINWYGWPTGWNKAFGEMYLKEFGDAVKKSGFEKEFMILEQKEKYGQCRNYYAPTNNELTQIANKYEVLSENICICCGKPDVPMVDGGWISPECYECYYKNWRCNEIYHKKYSKDFIPATDEEIRETYLKYTKDCNSKMRDSYTVKRYGGKPSEDIESTYDISETANKIRERWGQRIGKIQS